MKLLSVVGARPQFIKAALVSPELRKIHQEVLVHTGQHYDFQMSQVFFDEMDIPEPDYNLGIGSHTHATQTARMLMAIEDVLLKERPDIVLVYGDTNSTLAAAITASKMRVPIAHVEAGPRMHDMTVPEEVNRVLTDHLSSLLLAPTLTSVENLKKEGITKGVHFTGDVMYDAFLKYSLLAREKSTVLKRLQLRPRQYVYATVHRARNTDDVVRLRALVKTLTLLDTMVAMPLHPRTRKCLEAAGLLTPLSAAHNITLLEPVGYLDSLMLTSSARTVVTDSGGLQREAYFASVPCVTLDDSTAWPETVGAGWNVLADCTAGSTTMAAISSGGAGTRHENLFGLGNAARLIAELTVPCASRSQS